jgi:hypothetical protein
MEHPKAGLHGGNNWAYKWAKVKASKWHLLSWG